jgi:hypothetical protein
VSERVPAAIAERVDPWGRALAAYEDRQGAGVESEQPPGTDGHAGASLVGVRRWSSSAFAVTPQR